MRNDNLPIHPLPWLYSPNQEMTDEEVGAVIGFLHELTNAFENRYYSQLRRIADRENEEPR